MSASLTGPLAAEVIALIQHELTRTRFPHRVPVVTAEAELVRDLRCCVVDYQCLAMELDEAFCIEIPDALLDAHSAARWHTVADVIRTVAQLRAAEGAPPPLTSPLGEPA
ncbi:MAG: hypothetical protein FP826_01480 [Sphingomonadales bacterium]|nr:hypothetical protein [Sphingomonadales bacterium]MBU3993733.1 hypothetical protein [Alphaproteobacteria bacterium]